MSPGTAGEPVRIWTNLDKPLECPYCSTPMTGHLDAEAGQDPPKAGDFSLCLHCYGLAVWTPTPLGAASLRPPTAAEVTEFNQLYSRSRDIAADRYTALRNAGLIKPHSGDRHP